jgi:nitroimidazol reductase NimA-like FMN-containing flavoprotein (pyridoxamine 5'-phosphate oxidase superfamily)
MNTYVYGSGMEDEEAIQYLREAGVGTLAFGDERGGYVVPMSFGYEGANRKMRLPDSLRRKQRETPIRRGR